MSLTTREPWPRPQPADRPRLNLSDERLQALAAELIQALARIARRRF